MSLVTRPGREFRCGQCQKVKEGKLAVSVADHRHLNTKTSIVDNATEVENDWRVTVRKLTKAHGGLT